MVGNIEGFEGAVMEFTKVFDCDVNFVKLVKPELLETMKEGEGKLNERLDLVTCGVDKGKRGVIDEKMNDFVEILFFI
jgi:hypothetical protein